MLRSASALATTAALVYVLVLLVRCSWSSSSVGGRAHRYGRVRPSRPPGNAAIAGLVGRTMRQGPAGRFSDQLNPERMASEKGARQPEPC
jgi:hypothetical protein